MRKLLFAVIAVAGICLSASGAQPERLLILNFTNETGMVSDPNLGGTINTTTLADKGIYLLAKQLMTKPDYVLIDRRDFLEQMDKLRLRDGSDISDKMPLRDKARPTPVRPSFLQAAQALRTDVVLRGSLAGFSTEKIKINQGGYQTDFANLSIRVMIEALDATSGEIIAVADGTASEKFRQTPEQQTSISEDHVLNLFGQALANAMPDLEKSLQKRRAAVLDRPKVKLSVASSADPSLVEIDGILIGTTPLVDFEVYKGDHVLVVGKPGYQDVTKRILLEKNTKIEVPMIRVDLNADELKEAVEKMRMHVIVGEPSMVIQTVD